MVDENADRSYASGQLPAPERDIEPLWPVAEAEPVSWSPAPDDQNQPPSPPDRTPVVTGWTSVPSDAASAWAPRPDGDPRGAVADAPPAPPAPNLVPNPGVNLHQPFSLDPTGPAPGALTGGRPPPETLTESGPAGDRAAWAGRGGTSTESPWGAPPQRPAPEEIGYDPGQASNNPSQASNDLAGAGEDRHGPAGPPGTPVSPGPESGAPPAPTLESATGRAAVPTPYPTAGLPPAGPPTTGLPPAGPPTAVLPPVGLAPGPYPPTHGSPVPPPAGWTPTGQAPPTAEDFARRRQVRPADPMATMGVRAMVNRMGLRLPPGRQEQEMRRDVEMVRRNFGGLRQVTVVNPKGGAGKTVAILLLAMTFGQKRGGYVLAWDNNETQGTLGMRAQQDFHARTVRDLLRDLNQFHGSHGRVGDLSQYVRAQGEGMFDVLASDESATGGGMLTAAAFAEIREVVSRFYKLIFVDTGNNVRAQNWQAAIDATDQLVVTMSARNDSAETAARMLDHLEQSGRQRLVRQAVTVVSMPPSRKEIDLPAIQAHFAARTRAVLLAPYERLIDSGEPLRYGALSSAARDAWLKIAAAVAEGL
ncbi:MinD/ParA family ATP-binding protein [Salinispora fenicalii]|uniref:MinD/ParA family ATP-binding protein n=1 Tax=Salinispora fenicalii TaxID=1137263 RepID=UPI0004887185|nr:chromosome partitioning protein [Salinispora fenicalii]